MIYLFIAVCFISSTLLVRCAVEPAFERQEAVMNLLTIMFGGILITWCLTYMMAVSGAFV